MLWPLEIFRQTKALVNHLICQDFDAVATCFETWNDSKLFQLSSSPFRNKVDTFLWLIENLFFNFCLIVCLFCLWSVIRLQKSSFLYEKRENFYQSLTVITWRRQWTRCLRCARNFEYVVIEWFRKSIWFNGHWQWFMRFTMLVIITFIARLDLTISIGRGRRSGRTLIWKICAVDCLIQFVRIEIRNIIFAHCATLTLRNVTKVCWEFMFVCDFFSSLFPLQFEYLAQSQHEIVRRVSKTPHTRNVGKKRMEGKNERGKFSLKCWKSRTTQNKFCNEWNVECFFFRSYTNVFTSQHEIVSRTKSRTKMKPTKIYRISWKLIFQTIYTCCEQRDSRATEVIWYFFFQQETAAIRWKENHIFSFVCVLFALCNE